MKNYNNILSPNKMASPRRFLHEGENLSIKSSDGVTFLVDRQAAEINGTIRDLLIDAPEGGIIPLPITSVLLDLVFEYCDHYRNEIPSKEHYLQEGLNEWEKAYMTRVSNRLIDLIKVAHYLQNAPLRWCCFRELSDRARNKNQAEINVIAGIPAATTYTPEQIEQAEIATK